MAICFECGAKAEYDHHVIPESLGGKRTIPLCGECHSKVHGLEATDIRHLTKLALAAKKKRGQVVGSIPYGYRREGKALLPDLTEQAIIKTVNGLYSQGTRLMEIVAALNEQGKRTRGGRPWTPTQVKRLISEYAGSWKKRRGQD